MSFFQLASSIGAGTLPTNNFAAAFRGQRQLAGVSPTPSTIHLELPVLDDTNFDSLDAAVMAYQAKQNANRRHPFATAYGRTVGLETAVADLGRSHSPLAVAYGPLAKRRCV